MEPMNLSRHAIRRHPLHTSEDYYTLSTLRTVRERRELTRVVAALFARDCQMISLPQFFFEIAGGPSLRVYCFTTNKRNSSIFFLKEIEQVAHVSN